MPFYKHVSGKLYHPTCIMDDASTYTLINHVDDDDVCDNCDDYLLRDVNDDNDNEEEEDN